MNNLLLKDTENFLRLMIPVSHFVDVICSPNLDYFTIADKFLSLCECTEKALDFSHSFIKGNLKYSNLTRTLKLSLKTLIALSLILKSYENQYSTKNVINEFISDVKTKVKMDLNNAISNIFNIFFDNGFFVTVEIKNEIFLEK